MLAVSSVVRIFVRTNQKLNTMTSRDQNLEVLETPKRYDTRQNGAEDIRAIVKDENGEKVGTIRHFAYLGFYAQGNGKESDCFPSIDAAYQYGLDNGYFN